MEENKASAGYSYIKSVKGDAKLYFLAGACPLDSAGIVGYKKDFEKQTELCLSNALKVLESEGLSLTNICCLRVLVASRKRKDLVLVWGRLRDLIPDMPPATLQGVTVLGYKGQLVELELTASSG